MKQQTLSCLPLHTFDMLRDGHEETIRGIARGICEHRPGLTYLTYTQ